MNAQTDEQVERVDDIRAAYERLALVQADFDLEAGRGGQMSAAGLAYYADELWLIVAGLRRIEEEGGDRDGHRGDSGVGGVADLTDLGGH
jgi:hypothetical protein